MNEKYRDPSQVYDLIYKGRLDDVSFYKNLVAELNPKKVLEIGAGTGRILLPCAEENPASHFTAIDERAADLTVLYNAVGSKGLNNVTTLDGNFQDLKISGKFNLIVAPFRVLQHCLSPEQFVEFCKSVKGLLEDGGFFAFDVFDPNDEMLKKQGLVFEEKVIDEAGNKVHRRIFVNERDMNAQLQLISECYEVDHVDGDKTQFTKEYYTRWHYEREVRDFLEMAGFNISNVYGTFSREPVGTSFLGELIFTCQ